MRAELLVVLEEAQQAGFLGPGPVVRHADHALAFAGAVTAVPVHAADLGSGGGIPGLVLAGVWPESEWVLIDRGARRAAFLRRAIRTLGLDDRVSVQQAAAETLGADAAWRGRFDLVVARSFGPPAVTAECGAPLLREHGLLAVAEPPGVTVAEPPEVTVAEPPEVTVAEPPSKGSRWPAAPLAQLGLETVLRWRDGATIQVLRQIGPCPGRYPRRPGVPAKRPLW